jgi:hypothetical protein
MADASWDERPIMVFGQDLCHRAQEIQIKKSFAAAV